MKYFRFHVEHAIEAETEAEARQEFQEHLDAGNLTLDNEGDWLLDFDPPNIVRGSFVSDHEGFFIHLKATLDLETGEIDAEMSNVETPGGVSCEGQWFEPDNHKELGLDEEIPVCMECNQYILKSVVADTDGTNLEPAMECSNPKCAEENL